MKKEILFSRDIIEKRVHDLANAISREYQGRDLIVIGVLKGSFIFMADLIQIGRAHV